ncbi:carboxylesterase [Intrasporangium oryzae NRRL B-24470]|uniref:Carboxylic ester hydrolase n=1 Tax=Intrasporangium oryzae NRRL B-24470 TaxID=1386089 RepID=W9G8Y3_9MICO|nr:carboxylesterase family protein [Intrasporangium oryzae]EWT01717.1 carboxylesterase [Intrasporangium oryzae NRRL B-24470]
MHIDIATGAGAVRGVTERGLAVFRGIPYAALPVRLGAPQPGARWDGVREALRFGPPPPQSGAFGMDALGDEGDDWLTVNVWSPDLGGRLPVMVWIQGGAYVFGRSGLPEYDGGNLARGGVVVVTFNYRVGFEGFGYVEGMPVNRGLLDQVAALEWVQHTIGAFGGDPERVTLFGQSAGGGSVAALLAMPQAAGLFQRAIAQSVPGVFFTPDLAADITRVCASELGLSPEELSTVDPGLLAAAGDAVGATMGQFADRWGRAAHALIPFALIVDGDVLPTTPWAGLTGQVPLMVGHTRHEQRLLTALSGRLGEVTQAEAIEASEVFGPDPQAYRQHFPDPQELDEVVRSDWLFRMPSLHLTEAQIEAGGLAYLYELTWPAPGMGGVLGACHGLDVPLVFGNLTAGQPAMLIGDPTPEAVALSEQMRHAWTAFATTGDPGWPTYDTGATRLFDIEPVVTSYPEQVSRQIWRERPDVLDLT